MFNADFVGVLNGEQGGCFAGLKVEQNETGKEDEECKNDDRRGRVADCAPRIDRRRGRRHHSVIVHKNHNNLLSDLPTVIFGRSFRFMEIWITNERKERVWIFENGCDTDLLIC